MSGPKHLWSGDWESESRQPAAVQPPAFDHEQEPEPEPQPARASRRLITRQFAVALGAGLTAAAVTVALALTFVGGQKPKPAHRPSTTATRHGTPGRPQNSGGGSLNNAPAQTCQLNQGGCPGTTTVASVTGPSANWLGMQIVTSPAGVVIETVQPGSTADLGGFEPGDQIQTVDGRILGSVSELHADTEGVKIGHPVTIKVMRSSTPLTSVVPMTQRPTIHP